ncbi:hypothetical protein [Caniella muris]|uniref:hypothetical protein n=1 Tax=Caniella muris TaxID=2941502 RepID=UPI00203E5C8B|nr:hypothetical protein [Caniella muris]
MKVILAALTGVVLTLSLAGCSVAEPDSSAASSAEGVVQVETAPQPLEIVESGWSVNDDGYVTYAAVVRNPNDSWRCETPSLDVVLKDSDGKVLGRYGDDPLVIEADSEVALAGMVGNDRPDVSNVEFSMGAGGSWSASGPVETDFYSVTGLTRGAATNWPAESFRGAVTRNHYVSTEGAGAVLISVIARDESGAIVGGASAVMDGIPSREATPFEVPCFIPQEGVATYEAFARPSPKVMA